MNRANWAIALGVPALTIATQGHSWLAGLFAGLGANVVVYGAACYAIGKGRSPALGVLLGASWVSGAVLFFRFASLVPPALSGALGAIGLIGLCVLRDRRTDRLYRRA